MLQPHGIIPAMITPMTMDQDIDEAALRRLTDRLVQAGVHGVFPTGSQGEFWALTPEEKQRVWEVVVHQTAGRVPVYAGTAAVTTRETVALTRAAEQAGVDAVSALTPFFISPNQEELRDHYRRLADSTSLPILLYGNPARTGVSLTVDTVAELAETGNVVGIKDSSGDLSLTLEYIRNTPEDFCVIMGRDTLIFSALQGGATGAIAATGNVAPQMVVRIYDRFKAGDMEGAMEAQAELAPLRHAFTWGTFPVVIKEALDLMGEGGGPCRGPVGPMSADQRSRLKDLLSAMGLL